MIENSGTSPHSRRSSSNSRKHAEQVQEAPVEPGFHGLPASATEDPDQPDQNQINRYDVIEKTRSNQDQDSREQGDKRGKVGEVHRHGPTPDLCEGRGCGQPTDPAEQSYNRDTFHEFHRAPPIPERIPREGSHSGNRALNPGSNLHHFAGDCRALGSRTREGTGARTDRPGRKTTSASCQSGSRRNRSAFEIT